MADSRTFSQNALGDNAKVFLGDNHVTVNAGMFLERMQCMIWTSKLISTAAVPDADKLFLQEISQTDPIYDKKDILMRKGPLLRDSCRWTLDHEDFKSWYCTQIAGVFWIKGDPGKGKTMLLCGIIEGLKGFNKIENLERIKKSMAFSYERFSKLEEFEKFLKLGKLERLKIFEQHEMFKGCKVTEGLDTIFPSANIAFYFCQAADYRTNTAAAIIRGLIFTMLKPRPALLKRIREQYGDGPKGQLDGDKALAILCNMFETIVQDRQLFRVYFTCIVDALDECVKDCDHLLRFIIKTSNRVKWVVSS